MLIIYKTVRLKLFFIEKVKFMSSCAHKESGNEIMIHNYKNLKKNLDSPEALLQVLT